MTEYNCCEQCCGFRVGFPNFNPLSTGFSSDSHSVNVDCNLLNTGDFPILYRDSVSNGDTNEVIGSDVCSKFSNPSLECDCSNVDVGFQFGFRVDVQLACIGQIRVRNINSGIEQTISITMNSVFDYSSVYWMFNYNFGSNTNTNHITATIPNANTFWTFIANAYIEQNPHNEFVRWVYTGRGRVMIRIRPYSFHSNCNVNPCSDLRSSGSTESLDISISGQFAGESYSQDYTMLFQPDSEHNHGEVNVFANDGLRLEIINNFYARFDNTVSRVRGTGVISVWAHLSGIHYDYIDDTFPVVAPYNGNSKVLCQWRFDDSCCPYPTSFSENSFDFLDEAEQEEVRSCSIVFDKIVWDGFERLTDFCCDDSECAEYNGDDVDIRFPESDDDDDDDLDIECICDNLELISEKLDNLICICDNLSALTSKIDDLINAIVDKDFSVTVNPSSATVENTIQVEPTPITVNPSAVNPTIQVNPTPITVNPSAVNPTIQVNPTPITVNPSAVNPTIQVNPTPITVEPSSATVQVTNNNSIDGLMCDDESLACILKNALNHDDESISKIIKDKDTSSFVDVTVEPNELVNIRKVHYSGFEDE